MRVLVVSPDFPYPPTHGGRVDVASSIQALKALGLEVHLLSTTKATPRVEALMEARKYCADVKVVTRRISPMRLIYGEPIQVASRADLASIDLKAEFDFALLHSEYVAKILDNPKLQVGKIFLRVHNDECRYFKELARSAKSWRRAYYWFESWAWRRSITRIHGRVDCRLYISRDELAESERSLAPASWLPAGVDLSSIRENNPKGGEVLFLGSLFMPNNRAGLDWYLKNVHPLMLGESSYRLTIAGNSGGVRVPIQEWERLGKVRVIADPDDTLVEYLYSNCSVFVAPILYSGGVKIKVLNAILAGLGVVTTKCGVEGSGLVADKHLLVCQTAQEFVRAIKSLIADPIRRGQMVKNAQNYLLATYDQKNVFRDLLKLEKLGNRL